MESRELRAVLEARGAPAEMYAIGDERNEAYCLTQDHLGWLVYYSERGQRNDLRSFSTEHEACLDLLSRVLREMDSERGW
jgi:hypothetical protein